MLGQIQCSEDNRMIVRIWTSRFNKVIQGENVGHVSIETCDPKSYMSLWPGTDAKNQSDGFWKPIAHELKPDYKDDLKAEGRLPEITVCLYSLNASLIASAFIKVLSNPDFKGWVLVGNNRLANQGSGHSCASLAYHLLKAGGIYELISSAQSSNFSSIVTPDDLGETVKKAKRAELEQHSETQEFSYQGETKITANKPGFCCIL